MTTPNSLSFPEVMNLEAHEIEIVCMLLGALNLPLDLTFSHSADGFTTRGCIRAETGDSAVQIEIDPHEKGKFRLNVLNMREIPGRTSEVIINGVCDWHGIRLRDDVASYVFLHPFDFSHHPCICVEISRDLRKEPLEITQAPAKDYSIPYELQGMVNDTAADRLFALSRRVLHTGL